MAKSLNRVTLIGNLGSDPEIRSTPQGRNVTTLSIATTESYKDKNGVKHFTRKVLVTQNELKSGTGKQLIPSPLGFGRIKLWD